MSNTPAPVLNALTEEEVRKAMPTHLKSVVTPSLVQLLNNVSNDPLIAQNIRENFISYTSVLKDGKFKTEDYLNAVMYVSYKIMGHTNNDAYAKTFPQRYQALAAAGKSNKDISSYVAAYHKGKLVNLILEQTLVPSWVLNQDMYQKALSVQYDLMTTANSEKVRTDAANSILTHLKRPEVNPKLQIDLGAIENSGMREMKDMLAQLADQQRTLIQEGRMKTVDVAATPLIDRKNATDV